MARGPEQATPRVPIADEPIYPDPAVVGAWREYARRKAWPSR